MVDTYTKVILTIIAVALVWLGIRPILAPEVVRAADSVVRIEGTVQVEGNVQVEERWLSGLKVNCVSGCE